METFIPISNENGKMPIIRQLMLVMVTMRITKMMNNNNGEVVMEGKRNHPTFY